MRQEHDRSRLFGPVPSRRLGRSLGIDLVPHKVCSLDCIYCECGATTLRTLERREWVPTREVLAELEAFFDGGGTADYLTFSGAGEPTLHRDLGRIARFVVGRSSIPLALLTNATLFGDPGVRAEVQPCAVILPSLDAADDETYARINRPHPGLTAADLVEGLVALRQEYAGQIWLEVLLVEGLNDGPRALDAIAAAIARIEPDRVQVNTAVRPGTEDVEPAGEEALERALRCFGPKAEPVASFRPRRFAPAVAPAAPRTALDAILEVVRRRPETVEDLAAALELPVEACGLLVEALVAAGRARSELRGTRTYVVATDR